MKPLDLEQYRLLIEPTPMMVWRTGLDAKLLRRAIERASLDGFTLHAATRAGALDTAGREALLRYVLRPPVAQERIEPQKDGLIAITLKRSYTGHPSLS